MDQEPSIPQAITASGRSFTEEEISAIVRMVSMCVGLSRFELAQTICELLGWRRDNGALKSREGRDLLERLEARGDLGLPAKRTGRPKGRRTCTAQTDRGERRGEIAGALQEVAPVELQLVRQAEGRAFVARASRALSLLGLCHTLWGPVGLSHLLPAPGGGGVGRAHLHQPGLAHAGPRCVDRLRFAGTCYRAANWCEVGETSGRGRMDRAHQRHGRAIKRVFLYALHPQARERLRGER